MGSWRTSMVFGLAVAGLMSGSSFASGAGVRNLPAGPYDAPLMKSTDADARNFTWTGRWQSPLGSCTASVIKPYASLVGGSTAPAKIVANGHCLDDQMATNDVVVDVAPTKDIWFTPGYFKDKILGDKVKVVRIDYATMKGIDVVVATLDATYTDLAKKLPGEPLSLGRVKPSGPFSLRVGHAPVAGVEPEDAYLRLSTCTAKEVVNLWEYTWLWEGSTTTDCLGVSGGSSGAPAVMSSWGTGSLIIGLMNTAATYGYNDCGLGRPCTADANGKTVVPADNTAYITNVMGLSECFREPNRLDLYESYCHLPMPTWQNELRINNQTSVQSHSDRPAHWDVTIAKAPRYQHLLVKQAHLGQVAPCVDPAGYRELESAPDGTYSYREALPTSDTIAMLCVAGGPDATKRGRTWEEGYHQAAVAYTRVDNTPPTLQPAWTTWPREDGGVNLVLDFLRYEYADYRYLVGPKDTTDCAKHNEYSPYRKVPFAVMPGERACVFGFDAAGNQGPHPVPGLLTRR